MTSQIEFNNKKSYDDFNLLVVDVEIEYPTPKIIKDSVPFQNGEYDFSSVLGDTSYNNRKITITFEYSCDGVPSMTKLNMIYSGVSNWIYGSGESNLVIDYNYGYFIARAINISPIEILNYSGQIVVTFDAYPLRKSFEREGNDIWDIFNFDLDSSQETKFIISGSKEIKLYNPGAINITPTIKTDSEFELIKNDITYVIKPGTFKDWRFILNKGENSITIKGTGNIEFIFYKEVL